MHFKKKRDGNSGTIQSPDQTSRQSETSTPVGPKQRPEPSPDDSKPLTRSSSLITHPDADPGEADPRRLKDRESKLTAVASAC